MIIAQSRCVRGGGWNQNLIVTAGTSAVSAYYEGCGSNLKMSR